LKRATAADRCHHLDVAAPDAAPLSQDRNASANWKYSQRATRIDTDSQNRALLSTPLDLFLSDIFSIFSRNLRKIRHLKDACFGADEYE